jgi:cardiolipin synthase
VGAYIKKNLTVPNLICVGRILLLIPFVLLYLRGQYAWALGLLVLSGVSDILDGTIARRFNQVSELGKLLDPVADKVTQITLAIVLLIQFMHAQTELMRTYAWIFLVFLGKDLFMLAGGAAMLLLKMRPQPAEIFGKISTIMFYIIMSFLLGFAPEIGAIAQRYPALTFSPTLVIILVALSALLTLAALASYVPGIAKEVKRGFAARAASASEEV